MSAIGGPTHPIGDPQRIFELIKSCKEEGFQNKEDGKRAAAMALAAPREVLAVRDHADHSPLNMATVYNCETAFDALMIAGRYLRGADGGIVMPSVHHKDRNGHTPMHHTVFSLDTTTGKGGKVGVSVEMARTLVEHGADVNPVDKWGKTPYQNLTSEEFAKKADPRAINRMKEALESMGAK